MFHVSFSICIHLKVVLEQKKNSIKESLKDQILSVGRCNEQTIERPHRMVEIMYFYLSSLKRRH